jgi:hypothetical protein
MCLIFLQQFRKIGRRL